MRRSSQTSRITKTVSKMSAINCNQDLTDNTRVSISNPTHQLQWLWNNWHQIWPILQDHIAEPQRAWVMSQPIKMKLVALLNALGFIPALVGKLMPKAVSWGCRPGCWVWGQTIYIYIASATYTPCLKHQTKQTKKKTSKHKHSQHNVIIWDISQITPTGEVTKLFCDFAKSLNWQMRGGVTFVTFGRVMEVFTSC